MAVWVIPLTSPLYIRKPAASEYVQFNNTLQEFHQKLSNDD